jgi:Type I phosphodiesterase / nucleotide pyrophosphatase
MSFPQYLCLSLTFLCLSLPSLADSPNRAMVLVFDHMRAEYIDRFDLPNFKRAQSLGLNFDNGHVGHLESNTIISHPVITTGKLPKNLAWGAQIMKDEAGRLGPPGQFYTPFYLTKDEWFGLLMETSGPSSLVSRVKQVNSGPAFAICQKQYAAYTYGGPYCDTIICLGDVLKKGPLKNHHTIDGENVPHYISQPEGNRFYVEGVNTWGSEVELYALKGSGYVTGTDPHRPGGDAWVGDVVEKVMTNEPNWSVILASFGAIDKVSHVLAEHDAPTTAPWALKHGINLQDTLHKADLELGRILDRLEAQGLLDETVLFITADHGGQNSSLFWGRNRPGKHTTDSHYGKAANFDFTADPHPVLAPLIETGKLQTAALDTAILLWTQDLTGAEVDTFEREIGQIPGVSEAYRKTLKDGVYAYQRFFRSPQLKKHELRWADLHHQKLANTLASDSGPEFIATLFDNNGYAMIGAHGGAQELIQRIPMIVVSPNLVRPGSRSKAWLRLVDVNPVVGKLMGLPDRDDLDGTALPVEAFMKI